MLLTTVNRVVYGENQVAEPNTIVDFDEESTSQYKDGLAAYLKEKGAAREPTEAEVALYERIKPEDTSSADAGGKNPTPSRKAPAPADGTKPDDVVG